MKIDEILKSGPDWLAPRTVYMVRSGSWAYGTNIETSDVDYRGVAVAPIENYLGIVSHFEQYECKDPDVAVYDFRKFIKLAAQSNPNVLELLFVDWSDRVDLGLGAREPFGRRLHSMRDLFVTKRARATFAGYSASQLRKIKHNTEHSIPGSARYDRIQRFGFCTKNAMHLVRLLRMAREILETGQVIVKRPDAAELLDIRNGKWTLAELVEYAEQMEGELTGVAERSSLPSEPDMKEIDRRCVQIMKEALECL